MRGGFPGRRQEVQAFQEGTPTRINSIATMHVLRALSVCSHAPKVNFYQVLLNELQ